ncbi:hypothetical protein PTKIN_Ptkin13bG0140100 [Pterospermum kingtungense]
MDTGDWRTQLKLESRQRIVNKIMDKLKRHLPFSGPEGLNELRKIAERLQPGIDMHKPRPLTISKKSREERERREEKKIKMLSSDYLMRISLKMLIMENKSRNNTTPNPGSNSKPSDPGLPFLSQNSNMHKTQQFGIQTSSVMSSMQSTPLPDLGQNQQSSLRQSKQSLLQQPQPSPQPLQQPHIIGQQTNAANIDQQKLSIGQSNNIANIQHQLQLLQQQHQHLQQQQSTLHMLQTQGQTFQQQLMLQMQSQQYTQLQQLMSQMQAHSTQLQQLMSQMQSVGEDLAAVRNHEQQERNFLT